MQSIISAQCLLFDATPDQVMRTFDSVGAIREKQYGLVWLYPSDRDRQLLFRMSVASWDDGVRLGLHTTIIHEIIADMMEEDFRQWLEAVATAFGVSIDEARSLITEKSNVIVDCEVFDQRAVSVLRDGILALLAEADGLIWSDRRGWTSQSLREHPTDLRFSNS